MTPEAIAALAWEKMDGLLPAVVQDARSLQVLMLGYMDRAALEETLASRRVTFFSRSKGRLWTKGESSGHFLALEGVEPDCDGDALLVRATPAGPTCHRETVSCFGSGDAPGLGFLGKLGRIVEERESARPEGSYTAKLFAAGIHRIAQKVGEEGVELALAAKDPALGPVLGEAADLLFHTLVLLRARGSSLEAVVERLRARHG